MNRVLHAPPNLEYQLALLRSELREIFAKAPPIPSADAATKSSNRKPLEDDCPICCMEFEPEKEKIVYCKAACGNNIHEVCFSQWKASKNGGAVTCPFCRTPWQGEDVSVQSVAEKERSTMRVMLMLRSSWGFRALEVRIGPQAFSTTVLAVARLCPSTY